MQVLHWFVGGRLAMARFRPDAFPGARRWQNAREMRSPGVRRWRDCALMRSWPDWQWQYTRAVRSQGSCRGKIPPRCVPGRQSVASFALHASRKRPRAGKSPVHGKIRAPCIRNAPQTAVGGYSARISCQEGALFAARAPRIMHSAQILPSAAEQRERSQPRRRPYGRRNGARAASCRAG